MKSVYSPLILATLLSLPLCAQALDVTANTDSTVSDAPNQMAANQRTAPGLHWVLNAGLTYGGDTIGKISFTNGSTSNIKAGSLMQFGIGGLYQFDDTPLALMFSANYHFDSVTAKNGTASFDRFPIEVLAYYTGKEKFRFGGGVRIINGAELASDIGGNDKYTFDATKGLVAEIGYQLDPRGWLNFRFVSDKYQAKTEVWNGVTYSLAGSAPTNGSHMGVNFTYEF
ncbi:MAG: hypothetical protein WCT35_08785 [Sideroxydans sp.]